MNTFFKPILGAGLVLALAAQPALAAKDKTPPAPVAAPAAASAVQGLGVADLEAALANTNAARVADQQRPVTYKATIDQYQTRGRALQAQIKAMEDKLRKDASVPTANRALLEQQAVAMQKLQESGKNELNQIIRPVVYSGEFVKEQIEDKMDQAVKAVMARRGVTLLLAPGAVVLNTAAGNDLTTDIVTELNTLIPSATLSPPTGWEPRQLREARAQQAAQQGAAPGAAPARPATPAGPQPDSR